MVSLAGLAGVTRAAVRGLKRAAGLTLVALPSVLTTSSRVTWSLLLRHPRVQPVSRCCCEPPTAPSEGLRAAGAQHL